MKYSELFEDSDYLDHADKWLKDYTYQNLDKWPSSSTLLALKQRYPVDTDETVYRGMNFLTKEEFDKFMQTIENGNLRISSISSWSPNRDEAKRFSITRPTYFLNHALMQAEDKKSKEGEYMIGYRGVILSTSNIKGKGIDVRKSRLGHESEVILEPGIYAVEIEEVKPFKDTIHKGNLDEYVLDLERTDFHNDSFKNKAFKYIMTHHREDISDKARDHLFKVLYPKDGLLKFGEKSRYSAYGHEPVTEFVAYAPWTFFHMAGEGLYTAKGFAQAKKLAVELLRLYKAELRAYKDEAVDGKAIGDIADMFGLTQTYTAITRQHVKPQVDKIQASVKDINQIKDPKEKQKAIQRYKDDLVAALGRI